jgi:hypothetical protein
MPLVSLEPLTHSKYLSNSRQHRYYDQDSISAQEGCYYCAGFGKELWAALFFLGGLAMLGYGGYLCNEGEDVILMNGIILVCFGCIALLLSIIVGCFNPRGHVSYRQLQETAI